MAKITEQEIMEKYRLKDEQVEEIKSTIIRVLAKEIMPSKNPLVVVVGGQSGSGKTALLNYTAQMSSKREFIKIDNDLFRAFHPQADEIRAKYPDLYTAATDQIGLGVTPDIIQYFMDNKFDILLHQTLGSNRIVDDAMTKFKEAGYVVGVRAFAVPYFESKMSQIERCLGQIESLGYCRYVRTQDHDRAIEALPKTVGYIEESGKYDFMEVYRRGATPSKPVLVFSKFNPQTEQETLRALADCEKVSHESLPFGFSSARDAVERTRSLEADKCAKTLESRLIAAEQDPNNNEEMQTHIDELRTRFQQYQEEQGLSTDKNFTSTQTSTLGTGENFVVQEDILSPAPQGQELNQGGENTPLVLDQSGDEGLTLQDKEGEGMSDLNPFINRLGGATSSDPNIVPEEQ